MYQVVKLLKRDLNKLVEIIGHFPGRQSLFAHLNNQLFTMATTDYNNQLNLALAEIAQQDKPNFLGTSKRYNVSVTTLQD